MIDHSKLTASDYVPMKLGWTCDVCDCKSQLVWSLVHGECLCDHCEAPYTFFPHGHKNKATNYPVSMIRPESITAVRVVYHKEEGHYSFWELSNEAIMEASIGLAEGEIDEV